MSTIYCWKGVAVAQMVLLLGFVLCSKDLCLVELAIFIYSPWAWVSFADLAGTTHSTHWPR